MAYKFTMDELEMKIEIGTVSVWYLSEVYRKELSKGNKTSRLNAQVTLIYAIKKYGICLIK